MMEAWSRVITMGVMISSPDIVEGRADKICWWIRYTEFADELGILLRDRKSSRMNSSTLASINRRLMKLDERTKSSNFIGKWVHLNYYISCWDIFQEVNYYHSWHNNLSIFMFNVNLILMFSCLFEIWIKQDSELII